MYSSMALINNTIPGGSLLSIGSMERKKEISKPAKLFG
jgi:hypothetical protein